MSKVINDRHKRVVQVTLWAKGAKVPMSNGKTVTIGNETANNQTPGNTDPDQSGAVRVSILDPKSLGSKALLGIATYHPDIMEDYNARPAELADVLIHEFGHVFSVWNNIMGKHRGGTSTISGDFAVALENTSRRLRDPSAPLRIKHGVTPFEPKMTSEEAVLNWPKR